MKASQIRAEARQMLSGKWGKGVKITLIYIICITLLSILEVVPITGAILLEILAVPIAYGIFATFCMLKKNEKVNITTFLDEAFNNFGRVWKAMLRVFLKLLPIIIIYIVFVILYQQSMYNVLANNTTRATILLEVISAIGIIASAIWLVVKSYLYEAIYYVLYNEKDAKSKEVVEKSEKLMRGNRWRCFCLSFSFIGWMILATIPLGIGLLWLVPYIMIAQIIFFEKLETK